MTYFNLKVLGLYILKYQLQQTGYLFSSLIFILVYLWNKIKMYHTSLKPWVQFFVNKQINLKRATEEKKCFLLHHGYYINERKEIETDNFADSLFTGTVLTIAAFLLGGALFFASLFSVGFSIFAVLAIYSFSTAQKIISKVSSKTPSSGPVIECDSTQKDKLKWKCPSIILKWQWTAL